MNLSDRIYLWVHIALGALVCVRFRQISHWQMHFIYDWVAIGTLVLLVRKRKDGVIWEFAHDWLPLVFFLCVFEQASFLSLAIRSDWQNLRLVTFEYRLLKVPPILWLHQRARSFVVQAFEFGYFAYYPLYPAIGGLFWAWRKRERYRGAFRTMTDALSVGYVVCYVIYLLFPTQSPANRIGMQQLPSVGGPFHSMIRFIQDHAGVHGNAFPSAHIMMAFVILAFAFRFLPPAAPLLAIPVGLMCFGAVYDGYHYASDVVVGAVLGIVVAAVFLSRREMRPGVQGPA